MRTFPRRSWQRARGESPRAYGAYGHGQAATVAGGEGFRVVDVQILLGDWRLVVVYYSLLIFWNLEVLKFCWDGDGFAGISMRF